MQQSGRRRRLLQAEPVQVQSQAYRTVGYAVHWWNAQLKVWDSAPVSTRPAPVNATDVTADVPIKLWADSASSTGEVKQQTFVAFPIKVPVGKFTLLRSLDRAGVAAEEARQSTGLPTQTIVTIIVGTIAGCIVVGLLVEMSRMFKKRHLAASSTESILVMGSGPEQRRAGTVSELMALPVPTGPPPVVGRNSRGSYPRSGSDEYNGHGRDARSLSLQSRAFHGAARWDMAPPDRRHHPKQRKD